MHGASGRLREEETLKLSQLAAALLKHRAAGANEDPEITGVTADSRKATAGCLFIAIRGHTVDGHDFAVQAVERGAVAVLAERELPIPVPQLVVPDSRLASAIVADVFHRHPSRDLNVIGVTGTNGKTTTTHLIRHVLEVSGRPSGLIGTLGVRMGDTLLEGVNTTPEAVELHATLAQMRDQGLSHCVMEVSSHALELRRVAGIRFRTAVFTNLTQDHLDFHGTMERYRAAKGKLFSRLGNAYGDTVAEMSYAVVNADDEAGSFMAEQSVMETVTYGIHAKADVRAEDVELSASGCRFRARTFAGDADVRLRLTGRFNVYNALAALAAAIIEGIPVEEAARALGEVPGIPGRLEAVDAGQPFAVLVDYAHTPDSLENALRTVREFAQGRVITVIGCGGDRDAGKRPIMARTAVTWSHHVLFTSDNPRTEDPEKILDDMIRGVEGMAGHWERIADRRAAIARAIDLAQPGDVVLLAGKGHETYQIIGRTKYPFDDRQVAREAILQRFGRGEG
ncbi:MAG: UDP-N-acetylmuramoyl-L-alanyl-D-glutamate--2,6-diaminopimelate ligase [Thermoflavifilum sp.]|nr:UDP-N-acetylmuramoyl-L-alanyl-D-glutamate--2,6-diaminopimelate ligase [Thermoflavifilum sp.]MCL6513264.1 UDP-N-acetylmuramoyl-L-alanyl-D-glutamate--2,6-diaminopimelate ligase [Alicyclobacillus sp.]